jgi:hypothetical protein
MKQDKKCPECGTGTMKALPNLEPLGASVPRTKPMQARCARCGHQDDFTKFYPFHAVKLRERVPWPPNLPGAKLDDTVISAGGLIGNSNAVVLECRRSDGSGGYGGTFDLDWFLVQKIVDKITRGMTLDAVGDLELT